MIQVREVWGWGGGSLALVLVLVLPSVVDDRLPSHVLEPGDDGVLEAVGEVDVPGRDALVRVLDVAVADAEELLVRQSLSGNILPTKKRVGLPHSSPLMKRSGTTTRRTIGAT